MGGMTTESRRPALPEHEIPTMELDELRGTQLERLQRTVRAAYDNVQHYRAAFDAKGFPDTRVYGPSARAELRVITCGGGFSPRTGYRGNVVVFAHLTGTYRDTA